MIDGAGRHNKKSWNWNSIEFMRVAEKLNLILFHFIFIFILSVRKTVLVDQTCFVSVKKKKPSIVQSVIVK